MIIEAGFLFYGNIIIWGWIYLIIGLFFFIDDLLAELMDISIMKRLPNSIQEPDRLKLIGFIIFLVQLGWFFVLFFIFRA